MGNSLQGKSFFGRFKDRVRKFDDKDPGGRYFSILLEQVFYERPDALRQILFPQSRKDVFKGARVFTEFPYMLNRRADLAFVDESDSLIGLVEVKEDDQLGSGSGEQTKDYLDFIKEPEGRGQRIQFAYVTKHMPSEDSYVALLHHGVHPTFYSDIHHRLPQLLRQADQWNASPIAQLFCKFLTEEGVVYQPLEAGEEQVLGLLLRQGLGLRGDTGLGRHKSAERLSASPKLLDRLVSNTEAIGVQFHQTLRRHFGNRFNPDFNFTPYWRIPGVRKSLQNDEDFEDIDYLDKSLIDGGSLYTWSQGRLRSKSPCWIWVGFEFSLSRSAAKIEKKYYAGLGSGNDTYEDTSKPFDAFPDQEQAQKAIRKLLLRQIQNALEGEGSSRWTTHLKELSADLKALISRK